MDKAKRKAIIAGNWKMNKTATEAAKAGERAEAPPSRTLAVRSCACPTPIWSPPCEKTKGTNIHVGAENVHFEKSGAYTGEISADMLVAAGRGVRHRRPQRAPRSIWRDRPDRQQARLAALNAAA